MNDVINIPSTRQTKGEFAISYQQAGRGGCIPIVNGKEERSLMFGYASETDKAACMKLLEEALIATNGDIYETRRYLMNAVEVAANHIRPNEALTVEGTEILIDYGNRSAYEGARELANLDDIDCELPNEAIKALLINRVQLVLADREVIEYYDEDEEDDYDEDDDEYYDDDDEDLEFIQ